MCKIKEEKRIFVTNMLADSMFNQLDDNTIKVSKSNIDEIEEALKTSPRVISAIRNQKLVDTLAERYSIDLDVQKIRFSLTVGDVLFVINPGSASDATTDELLPDWATISVKKYEISE